MSMVGCPSGHVYSMNRGCPKPQIVGHRLDGPSGGALGCLVPSLPCGIHPHLPRCHRLCRVMSVLILTCSPTLPPSILPVLPLTLSTLCPQALSFCLHCHGSLQGTAQTACFSLSPAPCSSCDQERLHTWSCDLESVCLMCLASAHSPRPDANAAVASTARLPAWRVSQSCTPIALLFLALRKITKATDSKILSYLYKDSCVKMQVVHKGGAADGSQCWRQAWPLLTGPPSQGSHLTVGTPCSCD